MQSLSNMPSFPTVRSSLNHFPAHQLVAVNCMHLQFSYTPHLQHLSNWKCIWNPVVHLLWIFCKRAPSWICDMIPNTNLSSNLLQLAEGLRRSFLSLELRKQTFNSPCLLVLLIYTKHKTKRWNIGLTPLPHSSSLKLCKCSQIPHLAIRAS